MCSKHRHSCHTYGQGQQQTPEGTLHTYKSSISSDSCFQFAGKTKKKTTLLRHAISLAYDFHEDLLPVLAGLEAPLQGGGLREGGELLLDEVLPLEEVRVGLKGGFPFVCGLAERGEAECWTQQQLKVMRKCAALWCREMKAER